MFVIIVILLDCMTRFKIPVTGYKEINVYQSINQSMHTHSFIQGVPYYIGSLTVLNHDFRDKQKILEE